MNETPDRQPRKHALLIGIDRYPLFPDENQLTTCVADVELMAAVLRERFGFAADRIRRLLNADATYDGICAAMEELIGHVGKDDVVVIQYSGHGSQRKTRDPWEADGLDETIVPYDSGRKFDGVSYPNRDVADGKIHDWLLALNEQTPHVTLVFDSCHAGTITRTSGRVRRVPLDDRPVEEQQRPVDDRRRPPRPGTKRGERRTRFGDRHVLIAACRADQTAKEHKEVGHGALTYFLCRELQRSEPGETYRDLFERFAPQVMAHFRDQSPQLEGAWDREIFGIHDLEPMRYVAVRERTNGHVVLGAGVAHGLAIGSEWAVYPAGTRRAFPEDVEPGRVRVSALEAASARAEVLAEPVVAGGRAVELNHVFGEVRWTVENRGEPPSASRAALEQSLDDSLLLRRAASAETGDAAIFFVERGGTSEEVPQLEPTRADCWAAVDHVGELLMAPVAADDRAYGKLVAGLEGWCRFHHALRLGNPNAWSALDKEVDVALMRRGPDGWRDVDPSKENDDVFQEGDDLALAVTNRHDAPIYVAVLDFGLSGAVSQVYPVAGAAEALAVDRTLEIGTRPGDELTIFLPAGFPFARRAQAGGREFVKVFATTRQADFRWLTQTAVRGTAHPLERLLRSTLAGPRRGDQRRVPTDDWTTVTRSFTVRRKGG